MIGSYSFTWNSYYDGDFFRRRSDLHGVSLTAAIEFQRPFLYSDSVRVPPEPVSNASMDALYEVDTNKVDGLFKEILDSLAREMNFTYRYTVEKLRQIILSIE